MPTEHAAVRVVHKPWGVSDLQPWSNIDGSGDAVGELWFERADKAAPYPGLAPQTAVHQRTIVDPGSSGRHFRARDGNAERQERGMVHPFGRSRTRRSALD